MIAKTQEEIDILREGGRRLARHLQVLGEMLRPGLETRELEEKAQAMVAADGDTCAFLNYTYAYDKAAMPSGLCCSINEAIVHNPAGQSGDVIREGDIVSLDFGIVHKGLYTDHAVTHIVGKPRSEREVELVRTVYEAREAAIAQARVGNRTGDIGYVVQKIAEEHGFGYPKHLSGHGVGTSAHEEPNVPNFGVRGKGDRLVEGLVIAIEPMFTLGTGEMVLDPGRHGHAYRTKDHSRTAHAEHTVLITKDGPEIMTQL